LLITAIDSDRRADFGASVESLMRFQVAAAKAHGKVVKASRAMFAAKAFGQYCKGAEH